MIIELSVQKAAPEDATGEVVSPRAWVLIEDTDSGWRTPHEVKLLDEQELATLVRRYRLLRTGQMHEAEPAPRLSMCRHCGHRVRCCAQYRDRC